MINPSFGLMEIIFGLIAVTLSLALPLAILFFLYKIYIKLKSIEEHLKNN
jgi:preprotein translocase subunit SecD